MKITSAITLLLIATSANAAGIHKCTDTNGNISYSQTPCPDTGSQLNIESRSSSDPQRQLDEAAAAERSRLYTESQQRAAGIMKGPPKQARPVAAQQSPPKISAGDRQRLADIERSIKIRLESRVSQNPDEVSALQAERRGIYAKYGIDNSPRRMSDTEWEIIEMEEEIRDLKRELRN